VLFAERILQQATQSFLGGIYTYLILQAVTRHRGELGQ
jgi:hypothetical protein